MHRLLDINDLDVALFDQGQVSKSPGYASLLDKELVFGSQARSISRLNPGLSANQYWRDLNTQKTSANLPRVRHQADLAWNHLQSFDQDKLRQVSLIAVPSHYSKDQIALLSGILKSLKLSGTLLCKRSLMMASVCPEAEYHIDFQLHQLVVSKIEKQASEILCTDVVEYPGLGLLGCSDALLKGIQTRFIEKTRFDPLHHAVTEQQLFNQIVERLLPASWQRMELSIELEGQKYSIELSEQQLQQAAQDYLHKVETILPNASYVADAIFGSLPIDANSALYLSEGDILEALELILSDTKPDQEFSELTAISVASISSLSSVPESKEVQSEEQSYENKPQQIQPEQTATHNSDESVLLEGSATHILSAGIAIPAFGALVIAKNNRITVVSEVDNQSPVLGRFEFQSGELFLISDRGLSLNGSGFVGNHQLSPKDVISQDDLSGSLVAIRVEPGLEMSEALK